MRVMAKMQVKALVRQKDWKTGELAHKAERLKAMTEGRKAKGERE